MTAQILASLQARGLLSEEQAAALAAYERTRPFSLFYELRTLLSLGVTLLSTGLGLWIYKNLDRISHGVIVATIAAVSAGGFAYAYRKRQPFTWAENTQSFPLADYALLLGCLTFLTLEGYLQAQFGVFGTRYGLLPLLPAALFFYCAYRFDHRGVLAMAITALAAWVGVAAAPVEAFRNNNFDAPYLDVLAVLLGAALMSAGWLSEQRQRKAHFAYTYILLGSNLALVAACSAMFGSDAPTHLPTWLGILLVFGFSVWLCWYGRRSHSYLFFLMGTIYGYIAVTYVFFLLPRNIDGDIALGIFYFPISTAGAVLLLKNLKKIVRHEGEGV